MSKKYSAKEIENVLGIGADKLFYWVKTKGLIQPEIEGKGRGAKNLFTIDNLFYLSLVNKLSNYGIELNIIKEILTGWNPMVWLEKADFPFSIKSRIKIRQDIKIDLLEFYRSDRKGYKKAGLIFMIINIDGKFYQRIEHTAFVMEILKAGFSSRKENLKISDAILVDLIKIINDLEKKTGELV